MKTEFNTVFLDTNVLIYQTFEDFDREKHLHVNHYDSEFSMTKLKEIASKYKVCKKNIYDANIAATMVANQLGDLFTFNIKDFELFDEIRLFKIEEDIKTHE